MRRLMSMVQSKRFDPTPLLTHSFKLDQIVKAYDLFGSRRESMEATFNNRTYGSGNRSATNGITVDISRNRTAVAIAAARLRAA